MSKLGDLGVSGCLKIAICDGENQTNTWLQNNPDVEVVDIKFSSTEDAEMVMIIYRKE